MLQKNILEMIEKFKFQTDEAIMFRKATIPANCWLINKTIGEVYFWNYTEATIVAIVNEDGNIQASPGQDFPFSKGDTLILVGKDKISFDRVLKSFYNISKDIDKFSYISGTVYKKDNYYCNVIGQGSLELKKISK